MALKSGKTPAGLQVPLFWAFGRVDYGTRLEAGRGAKTVPPWVQIPQRPPISGSVMFLIKLLNKFRRKKNEPETVTVHFRLPNGKEFDVEAYKPIYQHESKCKIHWDYHGLAEPINGCQACWEYYRKQSR